MTDAEIDAALQALPSVHHLSATCSIDICDHNTPLPLPLRSASSTTLVLPLWFRKHWVLGTLKQDVLDVWDSAPSDLIKKDLSTFANSMAERIGRPIQIRGRLAARQPYGSRQCGIHIIVRALMSSLGIQSLLPNEPVVDWAALRPSLPRTSSDDPAPFTSAALVAITAPNQVYRACNNQHIPHIDDDYIKTTLCAGQTNHRFLVARHPASSAKPAQWLWGIATITRHKRASCVLSWLPLLAQSSTATEVTLPSASYFVFALSPLRPAPVTWDTHTIEALEPSISPTLHIGSQSRSPSPRATPSVARSIPAAETLPLRQPSPRALSSAPPPDLSRSPSTNASRSVSHPPRQSSPPPRPQTEAPHRREEASVSHVSATPHDTPHPHTDETSTLLPAEVINAANRYDQQHPHNFIGRDITSFHVLEAAETTVPELALRALAPATAANHRQLLRNFVNLPRDLHSVSIDKALIEWQCRLKKQNDWSYSTLHTRLASIAGALRLLPLYVRNQPSIHMSSSIIWTQALKAAAQKQTTSTKRRATPAAWLQVKDILDRENCNPASLAILTAWLTCGRMADVLRLRANDMSFGSEYLRVTFRDNKTRSPYTVATALPPAPYLAKMTDFVESTKFGSKIFTCNAPAVARTLKAQAAGLTQHSLRRGALQTLAAAGVPAAHLLHFSGHKSVASLLAYLDDGAVAPENPERAIQARILIGGGIDADEFTPLPPPSYNEVAACFNKGPQPRPPLHMKKVKHLSIEALLHLDMQEDTRAYLKAALRWVQDPEIFEEALAQGLPLRRVHKNPSFTDSELEQMQNYKFAAAASDLSTLPVYGFPVTQFKKGREVLRPIWEPTVNDAVDSHRAQPLHLPTRARVLQDSTPSSPSKHIWCQLDGVSCFDQVPLHPSIRKYFTFFWDGQLQELQSLPMGFRRAVEVACAILWALLDFPRPASVKVTSYVDNARFGGPVEETAAAVLTFVERAQLVGYQLDIAPDSVAAVLAASPPKDTFLGIQFDYVKQTRSLPPKTMEKLRIIGCQHHTVTHRQLACIVGLTTWCGTILSYKWHAAWHLLRRYAQVAVSWSPCSRITLSPTEAAELHDLISFCIRNKPVPIIVPAPPPVDIIMATDASKTGWGALAGPPGSSPIILSGQWEEFVGSSVVAEPEGAWQALLALQQTCSPSHVRLLTDHQPLVFAADSGRAAAWSYNALLRRLSSLPFHVSLQFLPGLDNPADAPSRGLPVSPSDLAAFSSIPASDIGPKTHQQQPLRFMT